MEPNRLYISREKTLAACSGTEAEITGLKSLNASYLIFDPFCF